MSVPRRHSPGALHFRTREGERSYGPLSAGSGQAGSFSWLKVGLLGSELRGFSPPLPRSRELQGASGLAQSPGP